MLQDRKVKHGLAKGYIGDRQNQKDPLVYDQWKISRNWYGKIGTKLLEIEINGKYMKSRMTRCVLKSAGEKEYIRS